MVSRLPQAQPASRRRTRVVLGIASIAVLLYWALTSDLLLPVRLTVGYQSQPPKGMVAYLDTGRGFREEERLRFTGARFSADQRVTAFYFGAPVRNLRLDPGIRPYTIVLTSLCLDSLIWRRCWSGTELERLLVPANDIENVELVDNALHITIGGRDPYLVFQQGFASAYVEHARVGRLATIPLALLLPLLGMWFWPPVKAAAYGLSRKARECRMHMTSWQSAGVVMLIALIVSGNWLQLDELGSGAWAALAVLALFYAFYPDRGHTSVPVRRLFDGIGGDGCAAAVLATLVALAPVFLLLISTWNQEFPYVGDQHFHLEMDRATYYFVMDHLTEITCILIGLAICVWMGWTWLWIAATVAFMVLWSHTEIVPSYFARYPGGGRFLAAPFFYLAETRGWDSLLNAARLANAASVAVWLLLLRPLIVRRWPDWSVMPVAAAFFFQVEVAYYTNTSYLEAWSLIFVLLAVEYQLRYGDDPRRCGAPMLLIGLAAIVKEAAVFLLPVIWLAGRPWRYGMRQVVRASLFAIAAGVPFLIYYLIRMHAAERPFRMVAPDQIVTAGKLIEAYYQFEFHFGAAGLVLLAGLALWLVCVLVWAGRPRWPAWMLCGGVLLYLFYINLESTSIGYAGYSRYYLFPYLLLCAGLFLLPRAGAFTRRPEFTIAMTLVIIALNGPAFFAYLGKAARNDAVRNFTEHYDAPVFMPIRGLIEQAETAGAVEPGQRIYINNPLTWDMPSIGLDYPALASRYRLRVEEGLACVCGPEKSVVLQPFILFDGLNRHLREPEVRKEYQRFPKKNFYLPWTEHERGKSACLRSMRDSCRRMYTQSADGEVVGILGVR